jgi:hypothetical protein
MGIDGVEGAAFDTWDKFVVDEPIRMNIKADS